MARRTELSDVRASAINVRKTRQHDQALSLRRKIMMVEKSKTPPVLVSKTLAIGKQYDNHFIDTTEVWLRTPDLIPEEQKVLYIQYQEYVEALKSLLNNINFIASAQNFGSTDKKGNAVNIEYMESLNFNYNNEIRSACSCKARRTTITDEFKLLNQLASVLEDSQKIILELEKRVDIDRLEKLVPGSAEKFAENQEIQHKIFQITDNLISSLQNNRINLDEFCEEITFKNKLGGSYNAYLF